MPLRRRLSIFQNIHKLRRSFCPHERRANRFVFEKSRQCANANQIIIDQALRHADDKNQICGSTFAERNAWSTAADAEHNLIDQIRAHMRKGDTVLDRARAHLLARD